MGARSGECPTFKTCSLAVQVRFSLHSKTAALLGAATAGAFAVHYLSSPAITAAGHVLGAAAVIVMLAMTSAPA